MYSHDEYNEEEKIYMVTSLIRTPIFEWYVVLYGQMPRRHVF